MDKQLDSRGYRAKRVFEMLKEILGYMLVLFTGRRNTLSAFVLGLIQGVHLFLSLLMKEL